MKHCEYTTFITVQTKGELTEETRESKINQEATVWLAKAQLELVVAQSKFELCFSSLVQSLEETKSLNFELEIKEKLKPFDLLAEGCKLAAFWWIGTLSNIKGTTREPSKIALTQDGLIRLRKFVRDMTLVEKAQEGSGKMDVFVMFPDKGNEIVTFSFALSLCGYHFASYGIPVLWVDQYGYESSFGY